MKALTLRAIGDLQRADVPPPEPGPGERRVRVLHCAVCRTDAKMWRQGQRDLVLPRILGHEAVGVSEEDGRIVAVWPGTACGACPACSGGRGNLCPRMQILGFHRDGGFAERLTAPTENLLPVPPGLDPKLACLAEPLACGINALQRVRAEETDRVLVCGGGPVGLLLALAARQLGCEVTVAETNRERATRAAEFRVAAGIRDGETDGGEDFDVAVNAAPSAACLTTWLPRLAPGGRYTLFSGLTDSAPLPTALFNEIHYRELELCGAYGCTREQMQTSLPLLRDHENAAALLIEREISLDGVESAFAQVLAGTAFKHIVTPGKPRAR